MTQPSPPDGAASPAGAVSAALPLEESLAGVILGTAVGDALGVPYEGLSRSRGVLLLGPPDRHRLCFGRGLVSDDAEHTYLTAQSLCVAGKEVERFRTDLGVRLRRWFAALPVGLGKATLRACVKLWLGWPAERSGVFSAGNGPAMRAAILGTAIDDPTRLAEFVRAATLVTHTDPKAFVGALAVALAARLARRGQPDASLLVAQLASLAPGAESDELSGLVHRARESAASGESTPAFADKIGCEDGASGYIFDTVPVAIHAWLLSPYDYRRAVTGAILCGGDADTTAAVVGGIVGAGTGVGPMPPEWVERLWDFPRSPAWRDRLAASLAESVATGEGSQPPEYSWWGALVRNVVMLVAVLVHLARRCLPPYGPPSAASAPRESD